METLPRGSSVCTPKAEVQSHLDPQEAYVCVCVCLMEKWLDACNTKTKLFASSQKLHFVTGTESSSSAEYTWMPFGPLPENI